MRIPLPVLVTGLLLLSSSAGHAQMGKMQWTFKSRPEVVSALQKSRGNLRGNYNILICAARQGYSVTALRYYEKVVSGHEFDASVADSALFAFAYDLANGMRPWYWKRDPEAKTYRGTNAATALLFRDRAYHSARRSPEVLVMRVFKLHYEGFKPERSLAYDLALRAVKIAPKWADAHYWLGESCDNYALSFMGDVWPVVKNKSSQATMARLGKLEMRSYDKAEKLNPTLRPYLYINRIGASRLIGDKQAARMIPIYADAHLNAFPYYQDWYRKQTGQLDKDIRAMYAKIAADIAKKATS